MHREEVKTPEQIKIMAEGGRKLGGIRDRTADFVKPGMTTLEVDSFADKLIEASGGKASFKMVSGYHNATCINVNEVVVHGIPGKRVIEEGDKVAIDVGLFYKGFHTDTATTIFVGSGNNKFLETGRAALKKAIAQAKPGKRVADLSEAMQTTVEGAGYQAVRALTGHGVGRELHEEPAIPCFTVGSYNHSPILVAGMVIAIEVMYNEGTFEVVYQSNDGWTIATQDGKISGLFEETVAVLKTGPVVLTEMHKND